MSKPFNPTWDLDIFFENGSESAELATFLDQTQAEIAAFSAHAMKLEHTSAEEAWVQIFNDVQSITAKLRHASGFSSCLTAQNVKDQKAKLIQGRVQQLYASFLSAQTMLDKQILTLTDEQWEALLASDALQPIAFPLQERRRRASDKLPAEQEALVTDLAVDGYHAWGSLYNSVIGRMTIPFEQNGETVQLSVGQASNMMQSDDRAVRKAVFDKWEEAFAREEELIASALNHLGGFRLQTYKHRGWDSMLREPLENNRMTRETLDVMWEVIDRNKDLLVTFLKRKADLLGIEKLSWYDMYASVGGVSEKISYDEGASFIIDQFRLFSNEMADFAATAFEQRWIEAEDRPGKRPGGFCTGFPLKKQTRIFMTYNGSPSSLATLAHELGHAYHQYLMDELPQMVQGYAMNVAETASTFAEAIVADAAVKNASTEDARIGLLEDKIQRAVAFYMDIHARLIFELSFYEERRKGLVSAEKLNELMVAAQKKAFLDALDEYHPHFWASKLHFYSTSVPFYNFPYTFGYLFSTGVYARALQEGASFADKYVALLRDTGRMTVEQLAQTHLGVDLTKPNFWQSAVDVTLEDIREFLALTENRVGSTAK